MTFNKQRTTYFSLRAVTTLANAPQDLRSYWTKTHIHQICSHKNFFIDSVNVNVNINVNQKFLVWLK